MVAGWRASAGCRTAPHRPRRAGDEARHRLQAAGNRRPEESGRFGNQRAL